jgi:hypothetical protein
MQLAAVSLHFAAAGNLRHRHAGVRATRDPASFRASRCSAVQGERALKDPAEVATRIVEKLVLAPVEHGRCYAHTDL